MIRKYKRGLLQKRSIIRSPIKYGIKVPKTKE